MARATSEVSYLVSDIYRLSITLDEYEQIRILSRSPENHALILQQHVIAYLRERYPDSHIPLIQIKEFVQRHFLS